MKKGYIVSIYKEEVEENILLDYVKVAKSALEGAGGKFIVRGMPKTTFEKGLNLRTVIIEFENINKAINAYNSKEYSEALKILGNSASRDIRLKEGEE